MARRKTNAPLSCVLQIGGFTFKPSKLNADGSIRGHSYVELVVVHRQHDPLDLLTFFGARESTGALQCTFEEEGGTTWSGLVKVKKVDWKPPSMARSKETGDDEYPRCPLKIETLTRNPDELVEFMHFRLALDRAGVTEVQSVFEVFQGELPWHDDEGDEA